MTGEQHKVSLVVGASRGAGRVIAQRLAREHTVLALGRDERRLEALAEHPNIVPIAADLADRESYLRALDQASARHGAPSVFVHAAASMYQHQRLHTVEPLELERLLQVDLMSAVHLSQWVLTGMSRARFGRIVYLGSLAAAQGHPGATLYCTAKAGLEGLCRSVALDYGLRGVTANTLSIGVIDSERLHERADEETRTALLRHTATGQFIAQDDIAELVSFLCGPFASQITGSVIQVTGGAHLRAR